MRNNITVIIPTMNRPKSLHRTIEYIVKSSTLPSQVIVIDQSTDKISREENYKIVSNLGKVTKIHYEFQGIPCLTKARNRGLELAEEEIIVFSDDDVDVKVSTFATISNLMMDSKLALIGGFNEAEIQTKNSILGYVFLRSSYRKRKFGHVSPGVYGRFPISNATNINTEWAMGFFFVVRKSLVTKWNCKFDENLKYYGYAEDLDFTYGYFLNANKENLNCVMSRSLTVKHNATSEYRTTHFKVTMMEMIHREYIAHKYKEHFSSLSLIWANIGTFIYRLIRRNCPLDVLRAMCFILKNRVSIHNGVFYYEKFMNL